MDSDILEIDGVVADDACADGFGHLSIRENWDDGHQVEIVITKIFPITIPPTSEAVADFLRAQRFTCAEEDEWRIIEYIQAMQFGGCATAEVVAAHKRWWREQKRSDAGGL